jgi:hypothetical protein
MDTEALIMGIYAEVAAGDGTKVATLGEVTHVEPPEGWAPLSEAAAYVVLHQVARSLWGNVRWMANAPAEDASEAWSRHVTHKREDARRCQALCYTSDAGVHLRDMRRAAAAVRCIALHPAAWEHVKRLLADDDHTTWVARTEALADEAYPGWRELPFAYSRSKCERHAEHHRFHR